MISLAVTCGLRRGELLGLEWKHIDLNEGIIRVRQNITYVKNEGFIIKEPKTKNSIRTISLPNFIIPLLKKYKIVKNEERIASGDLWEGGKYFFIFSAWHGKPLNPSSIKTWWRRFTKRHNLPYINFHALRHTSATLLINRGVHAKTISNRLGHANILTTMNIYGHVLKAADQEAASKFDNLLDINQIGKSEQA